MSCCDCCRVLEDAKVLSFVDGVFVEFMVDWICLEFKSVILFVGLNFMLLLSLWFFCISSKAWSFTIVDRMEVLPLVALPLLEMDPTIWICWSSSSSSSKSMIFLAILGSWPLSPFWSCRQGVETGNKESTSCLEYLVNGQHFVLGLMSPRLRVAPSSWACVPSSGS